MKRLLALTRTDIRFQLKYGFYGLYFLVTALYAFAIRLLPVSWRESAVILAVFTDPAALGLFFMGAILLLERDERTLTALSVSPVLPVEYVLAKLFSLSCISFLAGATISLASGFAFGPFFVFGLLGGSAFFTLAALAIGFRITGLNRFILATAPVEVLVFLPAFLWFFGALPDWALVHPGCAILDLLHPIPAHPALSALSLSCWVAIAFPFAITGSRRLLRVNVREACRC
jgi:fluoroquinolone transport system permease protein